MFFGFLALGLLQQPTEPLRLAAVGDINLGRRVAAERLLAGDTLYPFREVLAVLRSADLLFGNLESPLAPDGQPLATAELHFTAPLLAARSLAAAGFDVVSLANNHAWDGGRAGLEESMRRLTRAGVTFVGTGFGRPMAEQPVIVRRKGWRIAVFAVTRSWNPAPDSFYRHAGAEYVAWGDPRWIVPAIRRVVAQRRADFVVVSVHGGIEYADGPVPGHRAFLESLVDAGADLVLGHHPHVLQPVLWRSGKPILPSLGNFIFYQTLPWTDLSAIVQVDVAPSPDRTIRVTAVPVRAGFQAQFVSGPAADSVRQRLGVPITLTTAGP
jgi:poly-gamma-glutamate synthesis protein (capsule biosynthesis protein)